MFTLVSKDIILLRKRWLFLSFNNLCQGYKQFATINACNFEIANFEGFKAHKHLKMFSMLS